MEAREALANSRERATAIALEAVRTAVCHGRVIATLPAFSASINEHVLVELTSLGYTASVAASGNEIAGTGGVREREIIVRWSE